MGAQTTDALPRFRVSAATGRALARGHPWILRDAETDDGKGFAPGTLVVVETPGGDRLGLARIEGSGHLCARMWAPNALRARAASSVEARVASALRRRRALLSPDPTAPVTDAYRLVHGEADGLPGLFIDRLGPLLRVVSTSPATIAYRERAIDAVVRALRDAVGPNPPVVEVAHLREGAARESERTRLARGDLTGIAMRGARLSVQENGVRFWVDPGLTQPLRSSPAIGLFLDQRENRRRLASVANGGRWLNLFAHTGAFSVALLLAGARQVVSVDLSRAYLEWLDANLAANGLDRARHRSLRRDGRRTLEELQADEQFDGIVLDPPTAAAAGRRYWSAAKGLPPLVESALRHLAPGGVLFVSRNARRRGAVGSLVGDAAKRAGVDLSRTEPALPGSDFPRLAGFPEGDPFAAVIVERSARRSEETLGGLR